MSEPKICYPLFMTDNTQGVYVLTIFRLLLDGPFRQDLFCDLLDEGSIPVDEILFGSPREAAAIAMFLQYLHGHCIEKEEVQWNRRLIRTAVKKMIIDRLPEALRTVVSRGWRYPPDIHPKDEAFFGLISGAINTLRKGGRTPFVYTKRGKTVLDLVKVLRVTMEYDGSEPLLEVLGKRAGRLPLEEIRQVRRQLQATLDLLDQADRTDGLPPALAAAPGGTANEADPTIRTYNGCQVGPLTAAQQRLWDRLVHNDRPIARLPVDELMCLDGGAVWRERYTARKIAKVRQAVSALSRKVYSTGLRLAVMKVTSLNEDDRYYVLVTDTRAEGNQNSVREKSANQLTTSLRRIGT